MRKTNNGKFKHQLDELKQLGRRTMYNGKLTIILKQGVSIRHKNFNDHNLIAFYTFSTNILELLEDKSDYILNNHKYNRNDNFLR